MIQNLKHSSTFFSIQINNNNTKWIQTCECVWCVSHFKKQIQKQQQQQQYQHINSLTVIDLSLKHLDTNFIH